MTTPLDNGFWIHDETTDESYQFSAEQQINAAKQGSQELSDLFNASLTDSFAVLSSYPAYDASATMMSLGNSHIQGRSLFASQRIVQMAEKQQELQKLSWPKYIALEKWRILAAIYSTLAIIFLILHVIPAVMIDRETIRCSVDLATTENILCNDEEQGLCVEFLVTFFDPDERINIALTLETDDEQTSVDGRLLHCAFSECGSDINAINQTATEFAEVSVGDEFDCIFVAESDSWLFSRFYSKSAVQLPDRGPKLRSTATVVATSVIYSIFTIIIVYFSYKLVSAEIRDRNWTPDVDSSKPVSEVVAASKSSMHFGRNKSLSETLRRREKKKRSNWT